MDWQFPVILVSQPQNNMITLENVPKKDDYIISGVWLFLDGEGKHTDLKTGNI